MLFMGLGLGTVAISIALVHAYLLPGEWTALILIIDGVVLGYASLMILLGWALRRHLQERLTRLRLVIFVTWGVLGPVLVSLYSIFHCIKMFS